jgi:hypothetical protein
VSDQVLLVLDQAGGRWGLANGAVRSLTRRAGRYVVATGEGTISADRVLAVAVHLSVRPAGTVLGHYWPEPYLGMAVHEGVPVVIVSPGALPCALRDRRRESSHVTQE